MKNDLIVTLKIIHEIFKYADIFFDISPQMKNISFILVGIQF